MTTSRSELDRIEDTVAEAHAAGRRAAAGLRGLPTYTSLRSTNLDWLRSALTGERLLDEGALDALADLEQELHAAVEAEAWYTLGAWDECDTCYYTREPERRLTEAGERTERVRDDLARAVERARHALDLLSAARAVGRKRGFVG